MASKPAPSVAELTSLERLGQLVALSFNAHDLWLEAIKPLNLIPKRALQRGNWRRLGEQKMHADRCFHEWMRCKRECEEFSAQLIAEGADRP